MIFAAITLPELAPILTIFVGMLGGFYALVKFILSQSEKTAAADREERQEMTKAFNRVAEATERSAKEAEQRNGHLAEISITNKDAIIEAVKAVSLTQKVKEQTVEHQHIEAKE